MLDMKDNDVVLGVFVITVIIVAVVYYAIQNIVKKHALRYIHHFTIIYFLSILLIILFWIGSNALTWRIDTEVWAHFGSFIGAFLLAGTLLFQIRAFRRQQVEAKFFEMVKYYRNNVSEMRFRNPFYYENKKRKYEEEFVDGRRVLKLIFDQYRVAYGICTYEDDIFFVKSSDKTNVSEQYICEDKKVLFNNFFNRVEVDTSNKNQNNKRFIENEIAYLITFWGVSRGSFSELESKLSKQYMLKPNSVQANDKASTDLINQILKIIAVYECEENPNKYSKMINDHLKLKDKRELKSCLISEGKNKFFGGNQYQLGHYFRHLFQTVKYVDEQPNWLFSQTEKYDYVKTLRAQMSNYEQALLFINSLTIMGRNWEYTNKDSKCLITTYSLIKNLPQKFIPRMNPKNYYPGIAFEWEKDEEANLNIIM